MGHLGSLCLCLFSTLQKDSILIRWDLWQPGLAVLDVTNPHARRWYSAKLSALIDLGVDAFKVSDWKIQASFGLVDQAIFQTDFAERTPHTNIVFHDGSDPYRLHNTYSVIYNDLVFNLIRESFGEGEAVVFARSSTVGGQRHAQFDFFKIDSLS